MAKIVARSSFFKRKKRIEHLKLKFNKYVLRLSIAINLFLLAYFEYYSIISPYIASFINK